MKFFSSTKKKSFPHILAALEPKWRYITARRRWYALRLGLYKTLLDHSSGVPVKTRRHILVFSIANIKRQNLSDTAAISNMEDILYCKRYDKFHREFIKELAALYPEVILKFLNRQSDSFVKSCYLGLYIALLQKHSPLNANIRIYLSEFLAYKSDDEYADKMCLYSNLSLHNPISKLFNLNQIFIYYQLNPIELSDEDGRLRVTNLKAIEPACYQEHFDISNQPNKITVIVTAYNASETIKTCIDSLLRQTWKNIEIIVVDDASTDDTLQHLQHLQHLSTIIKVISLPKNVGTFAAKSIGAQYATGEFLTCQDSDDWAHPQKIAEQVQPLLEDPNIVVTTSYWIRLDQYGQYYVRQIYPFMRQNPASPMFRLKIVKQKTGLWHIVRTGADSEFFERLKLVFGNDKIKVVKKPLTIASHRVNSLMTSEKFGIYNHESALARLDYWEAWRIWHVNTLYQKTYLKIPSIQQQVDLSDDLFSGIPDSIRVDIPSLKIILNTHKNI